MLYFAGNERGTTTRKISAYDDYFDLSSVEADMKESLESLECFPVNSSS